MAEDNSIELFNCTLCTYCETSLDGLAKHIRKHIKPDPEGNRIKEKLTPSSDDLKSKSPETSKSAVSDESTSAETKTTTGSLSPNIEVSNPRTIALNATAAGNNAASNNDTQSTQPVVSTYKAYYSLPQSQQSQQQQQHQQYRYILKIFDIV